MTARGRFQGKRVSLPWVARKGGVGFAWSFIFVTVCSPACAEYQPKGKRDPFVPLLLSAGRRIAPPADEQPAGLDHLVLQGVVFDPGGESAAILNGHVLKEKQEWEGIKLLKIEASGVTVWRNGQIERLTLQKTTKENQTE